jgi:2-polyprenyl-3-methyl-5-hydroxy-6-metoxy-1,4-benzoquinol methylase
MKANQTERYGWATADAPCSCPYLVPRIMSICKELSPARVCDVGCGNGALAGSLHVAGYHVVGIEADADGIAIARSTYPSISFHRMAIEDDPASILLSEGDLFDLVVSTEVVEHLFSPHLLPIFAGKLLRPGGYLVVTTPYHGFLKNLALSITNRWDSHHTSLWHGGHIKFWSRATLTTLLVDGGFDVVRFYGSGRVPWLWKGMIIVAQMK